MATSKKGDVELVVSAKNEATQTINELIQALEKLGKEAGSSGIAGIFEKLTGASSDLSKKQDELTEALNRTRVAQDKLQKANDDRERDLQKQRDSIDKTEKSLAKLNAQYDELAAAAKQTRQPTEALTQRFESQQKRQESLAQSIQETSQKLAAAKQKFEQNQGVDDTASKNIEKQRQKVIDLGKSWRETTQAIAEAKKVLSQRAEVRDSADNSEKQARERLNTLKQELQTARALEKEKRQIVRESTEATDEEVQAKKEAIATTKRLKEAVEAQAIVEREAREVRKSASKDYREQSKQVDKLVASADKQKATYEELKKSLVEYEKAQKDASTTRQTKEIDRLSQSLVKLQDQYEAASARFRKTQEDLNKASGPDPKAIQRFEKLQKEIQDTELQIKEQTDALQRLEREYVEAGASAEALGRKERELESITEQLTQEQRELESATDRTADATKRAGSEATRAGKRFRVWGDDSRQALSFLQRIRGELLAIAAAYGGVYAIGGAVRSIYDASVLTQKATARLAAKFNGDFKSIEKEIAFVRDEADRLGIEFETLLDQYTKFVNNVPDGQLNIDQIRFTFSGIAEASRAAGLGTQDVQAVFTALGQIAAKGAVQLEELRQQLGERIPAAVENMAKGLSEMTGELVTTEELLARINRGEVSATAIVALAQALKQEFGPALDTALDSPLASLARFKNTLYDIRLEIARSGFIDELTNGLKELNAQMRTDEFREGMKRLASALTGAVRFGVKVVQNLDAIIAAMKAILVLKIASFLGRVTVQLRDMSIAATRNYTQLRKNVTAMGKLKAAAGLLAQGLFALPAAFYAGFAIGDMLQRQFPIVKKFGIWMVEVFETSLVRVNEEWDVFLLQMEGGFKQVVKEIAKAFLTIIPTVIWRAVETVGNAVGVVNESMGKKIRDYAIGSLGQVEAAADGLLAKMIDTSDVDKLVAEVRKKADAEVEAIGRITDQMKADIDNLGNNVKPEDGKKSGRDYSDEFLQGLRELDYYQVGVNAGKGIGESLMSQLSNIRDALAEESADTLQERLKLIEAEFEEFLKGIAKFQVEGDSTIVEIQEKAQKRIGELRKNQDIEEAVRKREIAQIEKAAAQEVAKIREEQQKFNGAPEVVRQLIEIRKEKERQAYFDKQVEDVQKRINDAVKSRQDQLARTNELSELGLITNEEYAQRLSKINEESITNLKQVLVEAKKIAKETGNTELTAFLDNFDNFEEVERRRAALDELRRMEQAINDQYDIRQTKLDTLNTLRETGAVDAATVEEQSKILLEDSNQTLGEMIDKAIVLAEQLGDQGMLANLKNMKAGLIGVKDEVFNGAQLSENFASGFTNAFADMVQGTESASDAFRRFFANFLQMIADAIVQALVLKAITGSFTGGNGGVGGAVAGGLNALFNHTGGVVGTDGARKMVSPLAFLGAIRYHSGGIAGLKPNEVPTILERGEEVLTRDDPRHAANGGGAPSEVKVVNTIDSGSFVSEGMNTSVGQKAVMNFIKANKGRIKGVLG